MTVSLNGITFTSQNQKPIQPRFGAVYYMPDKAALDRFSAVYGPSGEPCSKFHHPKDTEKERPLYAINDTPDVENGPGNHLEELLDMRADLADGEITREQFDAELRVLAGEAQPFIHAAIDPQGALGQLLSDPARLRGLMGIDDEKS
jgi:hypothetical protein